jgi:hypothetical protein
MTGRPLRLLRAAGPGRTSRDVLLEVPRTGAYRPLPSSEIFAELGRTLRMLLGKRGTSHNGCGLPAIFALRRVSMNL